MPLNHYVTLGRSGLRVSPFALGTMTFGEDQPWGTSPRDAEAIFRRYADAGGNFVDTANVYMRGHSEKILGDVFGREPALRHRTVLATKFYGNLFPGDPNGGGAGRKALVRQLEESLRRLRTDYVDLYWCHMWDQFTPIEETLRTLDDQVRAGKIRYLGLSDTPGWKLAEAQALSLARGFTPLVGYQIEYSLLERTVENEMIPAARALGIGVTPWSPLKGGALTGKYNRDNHGKAKAGRGDWVLQNANERTYGVVDILQRIAREVDSTPTRVALAWVQGRPGVTSTIIGARTQEQLDENLKALEVKLSPEQQKQLDQATMPPPWALGRFLAPPYSFGYGGTTVEGITSPPTPGQPKSDAERY
jgi:aryl-alcohol dehydrogenase-like predicted oxidoreductase